jgi:hypothetical protein
VKAPAAAAGAFMMLTGLFADQRDVSGARVHPLHQGGENILGHRQPL